jgi:SPP1 gp7 family putative phage head morphogenesis protein
VADDWVAKARAALDGELPRFAKRTITAEADSALDSVTFDSGVAMRASHGVPQRAIRHSKREFQRIGISLNKEPNLDKLTQQWREDSAARVAAIFEHEKATLIELLADSENRTPEELQDRIDERFEVTKSKIDTAAYDDVLTLNGQITQERQTSAGIESFVWTTAGDERVRDSHIALDGAEFRWDDPPEVDGEEAVPGEPYNCRCVAFPIVPELDDEE